MPQPQPRLRSILPRGYRGFTQATTPRHLVVPAHASVPLVVKLLDSVHRPPAFVMGAHGSATVLEGACAPAYLEVLLAPPGAYTLLGLPMDELSGQTVDLVDVLGAAGGRLAEQLREIPSWRQRFALVDQFLLRRLDDGPQPAPEVAWAWERLVATGGAVPIRRLANEVGWSHKHLIDKFRQQVGLPPETAARLVRLGGSGAAWTSAGRWTGRRSPPTSATPTRPTWSVTSAGSPAPPRPSSRPGRSHPTGTATRR